MRSGQLIVIAVGFAVLSVLSAPVTSVSPVTSSPSAVDGLMVAPRKISMRERLSALPRAATSSDGFIRVIARDDPADPIGFRDPLLRFAEQETTVIRKSFKLGMEPVKSPTIIIDARDGRTNDVRVITSVRWLRSKPVTRLILPSPGYSDIELLRIELAKAVLRFHSGPQEVPAWFAQGVLRAADNAIFKADTRFVLGLWRRGKLPFFPALCTDLRVARGQGAALAGFLAGRVREKKLIQEILASLASGKPWDGRRLAYLLTGETLPFRQDREGDEMMARLMRTVIVPGTASDLELDIFSSHLQLESPFFDRPILGNRRACTFRQALEEGADSMLLRLAAICKMVQIPGFAVGRGDELKAAAIAYVAFLKAFAEGKTSFDELTKLLDEADLKLEQAYEKNRKNDYRQG